MKKMLFLFVMLAVSTGITRAQVTVGKDVAPAKGVFLDLSPQGITHGGLLLPNVRITNADSIPMDLIGSFTPAERDSYPALKGMVVYNTNKAMKGGSGEGIYVWDGDKWNQSGGESVFTSTCTAASTIVAGGGSLSCSVNDPGCTTGGAYTFNYITGAGYSQLQITDAGAGAFTLNFDANDRAIERTVILMVTSPCGKSQTLFFIQEGDITNCDLPASNPKIMAENNMKSLCSGGAVYLYLDGAPSGNYIWTLDGEVVGTGTELMATRMGKYIVYANKIGCTFYKPDVFTVTAGSTGAPNKVSILAVQNNGFVCSAADKVKIFTTPASSGTIHWYKDGRRTSLTGSSIDAGIGLWFAVVEDGECISRPSDPATVQFDQNKGSGLINNFSFTVNGVTPTAGRPLDLCAGGMLNLAVASVQSGVDYTWYNNTTIIGQGASITYSIAGLTSSFILRCRATLSNSCSLEMLTETSIVAGVVPARPVIICSNPTDALCGGRAILTANVGGSVGSYMWYYSTDNNSYSRLPETNQSITIDRTGYYKVAAINGTCLSELSSEKNIALSSALTGVSIEGTTTPIHPGDLKTFAARMDNPQGAQYSWSINAGTTGAKILGPVDGNSILVSFSAVGEAIISLDAANACGDARPKPATYKAAVSAACTDAFISPAEGAPNQAVSLPERRNLSLTVNGGGSPTLSYQWYKGSAPINGAISPTYSKSSVAMSDAGNYYCIITSDCGTGSTAKSATFAVSVSLCTTATVSAVSGTQNLIAGGNISISVSAGGTNYTCQWYKNGTAISGATSATYTKSNATVSDAANYTCRVTTACDGNSVDSSPFTVTVTACETAAVSSVSGTKDLTTGEEIRISVSASGTNYTCQWYKNGTAINGATSTTYIKSNSTTSDAANYTCRVTTACDGKTVESAPFAVTVTSCPSPAGVWPPGSNGQTNITLKAGESYSLMVTGSGSGTLSYQWYKASSANGTPTAIIGATSSMHTITNANSSHAGYYTCKVTSDCGSGSSATSAVSYLYFP